MDLIEKLLFIEVLSAIEDAVGYIFNNLCQDLLVFGEHHHFQRLFEDKLSLLVVFELLNIPIYKGIRVSQNSAQRLY